MSRGKQEMATFASVFSRVLPLIAGSERNDFRERMMSRDEPCALRAMPNEEIHIFIKRIDNNHVIRTEDKQATATCWKTIGMAGASALVAVGMIVPTAYGKLAGYQIERSRDEQGRLRKQIAQLEAVEAQLLSPATLARIADDQQFVEASAETMVVLNIDRTTSLAMNQGPKK